jgi:ATP-dependent Clp protease ATP-binding subunit ClpA
MMFERFTGDARNTVVQAQEHARRLGHRYIGCEHLLLAAASTGEPASAALREHGVTPQAVETEIVRLAGLGQANLFSALDREALASIGIDLDAVRARIEAAFGSDAFTRAGPYTCRKRRPALRKNPLTQLRHPRRAGRNQHATTPGGHTTGHIPFTPRAKKSLEHSLREAKARHDNYIGVEHLTLALVAINEGAVPPILSALGASPATLRAAILDRYRQAS